MSDTIKRLESDLAAVEAVVSRLNGNAEGDYQCADLRLPLTGPGSVPCTRKRGSAFGPGWPSLDGPLTARQLSCTCDNCIALLYASRLSNAIRAEIHRQRLMEAEHAQG